MTTRDDIARMIDNELSGFGSYSVALGLADRILAAIAAAARQGRDVKQARGASPAERREAHRPRSIHEQ